MADTHREGPCVFRSAVGSARHVAGAALALLLLVAMTLRAGDAPNPEGLWQQIDDHTNRVRTLVRIAERAGVLSGTIEQLFLNPGEEASPPPRCTKCTDARKDQTIVGMVFLSGLKRETATSLVWSDGEIVDPETGAIYRSKVTLSPDGQTLHVRGYIGISLLGRTQTWRRAP